MEINSIIKYQNFLCAFVFYIVTMTGRRNSCTEVISSLIVAKLLCALYLYVGSISDLMLLDLGSRRKNCVFPVTRPYLEKWADPNLFI